MDSFFNDLRKREFARLDESGQIYLDYTGGGLYSQSQIDAYSAMLTHEVLGNPHSHNPTSLASTHYVEQARERILRFFNADPAEYEVIFTLNASGALKLVGESYPFEPGGRYVLLADNHNSVNGIREFAISRGAEATYITLDDDLRASEDEIKRGLSDLDRSKNNLFSMPAQSNFSGVRHPLAWVELARDMGCDVVLDAAAYVPTSRLNLREVRPDFASVSFYKMFGFPTGVGALIARYEAISKLHRPWFAGGTVRFVAVQNKLHLLEPSGEAFEDGTLNYLSIPAVVTGLDFLDRIGMDRINARVADLTAIAIERLTGLRHSNGSPLVQLYGPANNEMRGGTMAFNLLDPAGELIDCDLVEQQANAHNISIRSGCFCNPGASEIAFQYDKSEALACLTQLRGNEFSKQKFSACMSDAPVGAVRMSVGIATSEADLDKMFDFLAEFCDLTAEVAHADFEPKLEVFRGSA